MDGYPIEIFYHISDLCSVTGAYPIEMRLTAHYSASVNPFYVRVRHANFRGMVL